MESFSRPQCVKNWLDPEKPSGFLANLSCPNVGDLEYEIEVIASEIASNAPPFPNEAAMLNWLVEVGKRVRSKARTRGWPVPLEFADAITHIQRNGSKSRNISAQDENLFDLKVHYAQQFFQRKGAMLQCYNEPEIIRALIDRRLVDQADLERAGTTAPTGGWNRKKSKPAAAAANRSK